LVISPDTFKVVPYWITIAPMVHFDVLPEINYTWYCHTKAGKMSPMEQPPSSS